MTIPTEYYDTPTFKHSPDLRTPERDLSIGRSASTASVVLPADAHAALAMRPARGGSAHMPVQPPSQTWF
ncbi:hypothetical protein K466DRAFT_361710 [Polyporus arcularius HHB13444]|uniref:Uncharacterized protein n=1 Tax=Polyporus arcularius HHB13444 TaxID=1314778 RepID=A0A5C3NUA1_9APHY|nr:hypothetical protein K466DRAFT_361710 [Polyporus arcularius HHB13444]